MEQPTREPNQLEQVESAELERVGNVVVQEAEFVSEAKRTEQRRFGSAMMLGTVFAGMLAAGEASAGDYRKSKEYERYQESGSIRDSEEYYRQHQGRRGLSSELGRRLISGGLDAAERIQSSRLQQAQQVYAELHQQLQRLEMQIGASLDKAHRRAQRLQERGDSQGAQVLLEQNKQETEPALQARALLELDVRKAMNDAEKQRLILEALRQGRYIARR